MTIETLLTTRELAKRLRVSHRTIEGWRIAGGGPRFVRFFGRVLYRERDVREFIELSVRTSTADHGISRAA